MSPQCHSASAPVLNGCCKLSNPLDVSVSAESEALKLQIFFSELNKLKESPKVSSDGFCSSLLKSNQQKVKTSSFRFSLSDLAVQGRNVGHFKWLYFTYLCSGYSFKEGSSNLLKRSSKHWILLIKLKKNNIWIMFEIPEIPDVFGWIFLRNASKMMQQMWNIFIWWKSWQSCFRGNISELEEFQWELNQHDRQQVFFS